MFRYLSLSLVTSIDDDGGGGGGYDAFDDDNDI